MIKAIFFDFDGTISDAMEVGFDAMVRAFEDFGFEFNKKELRGLLGIKIHLILKEMGLETKNAVKVRNRFYKYFIEGIKGGEIRPCCSLKPLWELKKDYPLIVVSNSDKKALKASIRVLGLEGLFEGSYGSKNFSSKDKILKKLFRKMKIRPSEACYVGDRFSDIDFARKAGCIAIAMHNKCSISSLAQMKKEKPDVVIKNFYELRKFLMTEGSSL